MQRCFGLDHDRHPAGCSASHERVGDLGGELFLDLQPAREDVDDARDLGEADHFAIGDVGDVRFADEGQQMMFAHRIKLDVFHHHDLARVGIEDRAVDHVLDALPITLGEKLERARGASRCSSRDPAGDDLRPTASRRSPKTRFQLGQCGLRARRLRVDR